MTARPATTPEAADAPIGAAWFNACGAGAEAWVSYFKVYADACRTLGRTQADMVEQWMALWGNNLPGGGGFRAADDLLREELLMAETQSERLAEAVQQTLRDLDSKRRGDRLVPLPE